MNNFCIDCLEYDIFMTLKKIGCCFKCSLRFCGVNFLQSHFHPKTFLIKPKYFHQYDALLDTEPCVICLGILQNNKFTTFINKMIKQAIKNNYDSKTISLLLAIPIALQIRERAVCIYLYKNNDFFKKFDSSKVKIQNLKDVWKSFLLPEIEYSIDKHLEISNITSPLTVEAFMSYPQDQAECMEFFTNYAKLLINKNIMNKREEININKKTIDIILNSISDDQFEKCFMVPPKRPSHFITIDKFLYKHSSIFIGGRYVKHSRQLCQTPWFVNGKLKMENSVQELIGNYIMDHTKADSMKFLSSGREDVDVRMLFNGRPFAVELINPKITQISQKNLMNLRENININTNKIKISSDLKMIIKHDLKILKEGEYSKSKTYRALCIFKKVSNISYLLKKLKSIKNLKIIQNTPIRVLHRRTLTPRERVIYELRARFPNKNELQNYGKNIKNISDEYKFIILDFKTQAGTYIKEFVHGDFGRTKPNLCYILKTQIDIIALDVTNISLQWP